MQAETYNFNRSMYNEDMPPGRPANKPRTPLGEQISLARLEKGMTQEDLANALGVTQRVITYWEREPVALKPEQMSLLADALAVTADYLLGREKPKKRGSGPAGKAKLVFEEVSELPRRQQERVVAVVEDMLIAAKAKAS
ncbi:MAG: helix-turn-helix domain-containing protein [Verrucomicrobiales bacterium]|nr:helix-turn-helix domain-containing protein [Verrucomicrobiales bacterium]